MSSPASLPVYGTTKCRGVQASGKACKHNAYYVGDGGFYCGVHTKSRTQLPKLSAGEERRVFEAEQAARDARVAEERAINRAAGRAGRVTLSRMGMRRAVAHRDGALSVFPNNRHAGRRDGKGLATLSPMQLGPVAHGQAGLPDALNLENFWQFSKQFADESDAVFVAAQRAAFRDPEAHRHKRKLGKDEARPHWVWTEPDARHTLAWVDARQFYCNFYERLARAEPEWNELQALVRDGTNVQLCGYDAVPMDDVDAAYLSTTASFGHERVLYAMLTIPNEADWPWRKHKTFAF